MKIRCSVILLVVASGFFDNSYLSKVGTGKSLASGERGRVACLDLVRDPASTIGNPLSAQERDSQSFRAHIFREREKTYQTELPDRMSSFFGGREHDMILPVSLPDSHAFYLDSGADVFRLMLDFPGAENFHLLLAVDSAGDIRPDLVRSIKRILETISTSVAVEGNGSWNDLIGLQAPTQLVLNLEFDFPDEALRQTRRIWIHPFDPKSIRQVKQDLLENLSFRGPWLGFIGNGLINMSGRGRRIEEIENGILDRRILDRLSPRGWYVGVENVRALGVELSRGLLTSDSEKEVITDVLESLGADSTVQSADRAFEVKVDPRASFFPSQQHPKVRQPTLHAWAEIAILIRSLQTVSDINLSVARVSKVILDSRIPVNTLIGAGGSENYSSVVAGVIDRLSSDLGERIFTRLERLGSEELAKILMELHAISASREDQSSIENHIESLLIRYPEVANVKWRQSLRTLSGDHDFRISMRFRMIEFLNDHVSKNPDIQFPEDWALNSLDQIDRLWWEQLDRLNPFFAGEFLERVQQWPASYQKFMFGYFFYFSEILKLENKNLGDPSNLVLLRGLVDTPIALKRFLDLLYRQKIYNQEIDREELLRLAKSVAAMNEAFRVRHSLFQADISGNSEVINPQRLAIELLGAVDGEDKSADNRLKSLENSPNQEVALASNLALLMRGKNLVTSRPILDSLERGEYRVLIELIVIHKKRDLRTLRSEIEGTMLSSQLVDLMTHNEFRVGRVLLNILVRAKLWGLDPEDVETFVKDLELSEILEREKQLRAKKKH